MTSGRSTTAASPCDRDANLAAIDRRDGLEVRQVLAVMAPALARQDRQQRPSLEGRECTRVLEVVLSARDDTFDKPFVRPPKLGDHLVTDMLRARSTYQAFVASSLASTSGVGASSRA
jgi:hypothetical protein